MDPCELLSSIEVQIIKANEESLTRKDIMERVDKWLSACDEETWLEEYNQVGFFSLLKDYISNMVSAFSFNVMLVLSIHNA